MREYLPRICFVAAVLLALSATVGSAQDTGADAGAPRGAELSVYLLTMGPGPAVWELFGHNAILIRDASTGIDIAYNYGMFSFEQENFILRFLRGEMDYWMEGFDANWMVQAYVQADRSVWAQELNLTPEQRAELRDFLEWNALPENRVYRYDYYRDNCSTRVRDAIDRVLGGAIAAQTADVPSGRTYRDLTRALTAEDPPLYAGLMLGLGQPVDREISVWEEMFLPMRLRERIRDIRIEDGAGGTMPLVLSEREIYLSSRPLAPAPESDRLPAFLTIGVVLGALAAGAAYAPRRAGRIVLGTIGAAWGGIAGLLGVILVLLWAFTEHAVTYRNENLFFINPLLLGLAVLIPWTLRSPERRLVRDLAVMLGLTVAAISILGFALQALPGLDQVNGEIIALALPVNLGLAAALRVLRAPMAGREPASRGTAGDQAAAPV